MTRNRVIDFWRAAAIAVVVFGHWLAASIWLRPEGEIVLMNSLEWIPHAGWVTWVVQVMPIFFFVGGYANARAMRRVTDGDQRRRDWISGRVRRLFTPVVPLLVVWVVLIVALRPFVPPEVVRAGAMSATVPLWFIAVYLLMVAAVPVTYRWWLRSRWASVAVLAVAAIAVDVVRFGADIELLGWVNFLFVWAAIHQLGYWWAARDASGRPISPWTGWLLAVSALGVLVAVTWAGWYPVAMIGVPGAELTNVTPPTGALMLLALMQAGVILATQPLVRRLTAREPIWHAVVAVSGVMMTIYLWHLSAMSLVAAGGLFTLDGVAFSVEPGTTAWWVTRPVWIAALIASTLALVAVFARFEWRINPRPLMLGRRVLTVGVLMCAASAGAVAFFGLAGDDVSLHWVIPVAAIVGAALIGAYPRGTGTDQAGGRVAGRAGSAT